MNNFENTEKTENARLLEQKNNVMRKNIVLFSILQKIKEKCRDTVERYENNNLYDEDQERFRGEAFIADEILQLMDIQEAEE